MILGRRDEHEAKCQFAKTVCPIGGERCGTLRLNQMDVHMTSCNRVPCPFSNFGESNRSANVFEIPANLSAGCMYHGTSVSVAEHKSSCSYKDESQLLIITMREVCTRSLKNTPCSGRPVYITSNPSSCYTTIIQFAIHLTDKRSPPKGTCIR